MLSQSKGAEEREFYLRAASEGRVLSYAPGDAYASPPCCRRHFRNKCHGEGGLIPRSIAGLCSMLCVPLERGRTNEKNSAGGGCMWHQPECVGAWWRS